MPSASQIGSRFKIEFLAQIITAASGALLIFILARLLDPDGYGLLYLTLSVVGIAKLFAQFGVRNSAARYIAEYKEKDSSQILHIIKFSMILIVVLLIIVSTFIVLFRQMISDFIGEPELTPFLLVGVLYLIFVTLAGYSRYILQGMEKIQFAAVIESVKGLGRLLFATLLVIAGFGALGALVGYVLSAMLGTVIGFLMLYYYLSYGFNYRDGPMEKGLKRRIAEYSLPLAATNTANVLDKDVDTVLVGFFLNPIAVSYYVVSKQIITFLETPATALGFTISPTFGAEKADGNLNQVARLYRTSLIHSLLLYIPAAAGIILVADPIISLAFGTEYTGAVPVLQVLAPYAIFLSINKITSHGLDFLGKARQRAIIKGITSILNVIFNIILIPTIGVVGAAFATVVTYSLYSLANVYIFHLEVGINIANIINKTLIIVLITSIMSIVVFFLLGYIEGWITLILVVSAGVLVWAVLSTLVGLLDTRKIISTML